MPDEKGFYLTYHEVVEALIKQAGLHEGIWGMHVEFGLGAGNVQGPTGAGSEVPAAILPIAKLGLRKYESEGPLALDAAKVNPVPKEPRKKKGKAASEILTGTD